VVVDWYNEIIYINYGAFTNLTDLTILSLPIQRLKGYSRSDIRISITKRLNYKNFNGILINKRIILKDQLVIKVH
jgi:hypothetical protein